MKDYNAFNEARELGHIYPELEKFEQVCKEANLDPGEVFLDSLDIRIKEEYKEILNEFDPLLWGAGAYAAKKGLDKIGGWQGLKNIAQTGWQGLKNTGQAVKGAYDVQRGIGAKNAAQKNAALGGGTVSYPATANKDPQQVATWADSIKISAQNLANNVSDVMKNDPQMRQLMDLIAKTSDQLKQRATSVVQTNPATP